MDAGKATSSLDSAVDKLKESSGSGETIDKAKSTIKDLTSQAGKLSAEYDLPAKAKQVRALYSSPQVGSSFHSPCACP